MDEMKRQGGWEDPPAGGQAGERGKTVGEDTLNDILASIGGAGQAKQPAGNQPAGGSSTTIEVDKHFRDFFTNTVAVIPENALVGGTAVTPEEDEGGARRRGFFGRLRSLFRRSEEEDADEDAGQVLVPGRAGPPQPEEEFDAPLQPVEPEDNTTQIDLHLMAETPEADRPAAPGDLTGEIRLAVPDEVAPGEKAAREPAKDSSAPGAGRIRFMEGGGKPRPGRKKAPGSVPPKQTADASAPAQEDAAKEPADISLTEMDDADIAELLAVQQGVLPEEPPSRKAEDETLPPQKQQAGQEPPQKAAPELAAPAKGPLPEPAAEQNAPPDGTGKEPPLQAAADERTPPQVRAARPEKKLSFEDIDIDAILAEGAQKAAREKEQAAASGAASAPAAEETAARESFETPLQPGPEPPQEKEQPAAAAQDLPDAAPVEAQKPPQTEQDAEQGEPTGEIRLEPVEASDAPDGPDGEICLTVEGPAEEPPAVQEPAPAGEEGPQAEEQLLTGEVPLVVETADEQAARPADEAAANGPESRAQKAHTAAVRLFGGEEEADAEEPDAGEAAGEPLPEEEPAPVSAEYEDPADAEAVAETLRAAKMRLALRTALTGILGAALLVLGLTAQGGLTPGAALDPETAPAAFIGVNLILLLAAAGVSRHILRDGFAGLVGKPSPDTLPALATAAAVLQLLACLAAGEAFDPLKVTVFSSAAALLLFADTLGSWLMTSVVQGNFDLVSAGVEHSAAYRLKDRQLAAALAAGMDEENPALLLNRPAALMKGFLAQSFSPRRSDKTAQKLARILLAAAAAGAAIVLIRGGGVLHAATALAGVLCLGAPLSATLVSAVPSLLMQRSASRVGAVIPGWYNIAQLGEVDMVQVDAKELFTPACAQLFGIKTFQKERIDLAILYATSILIEGCNTLEGLFRGMIENRTDMLYEVKDLEKKPGLGFTAWCDNCRVVLGTRAMMALEEIPLPAMDYENRYSKDGRRHVLYLAVSGKLYAMFLLGYTGERSVARSMATLRRENIRLLVTADDPTLTAERIEDAYRLERGFVKVLSAEERKALEPATLYLPAAEGCMVHLGSFASFVGGLKAAAGADEGERSACAVQTVSVLFSVAVALLLCFTGGLTGVSLVALLLYQIAWSALSVAITLTKKY